MSAKEISDKARDLCNVGCGCDEDATDGCPNWDGGLCTYQAFAIQAALQAEYARGMADAREIVVYESLRDSKSISDTIAAIDARLSAIKGGEG